MKKMAICILMGALLMAIVPPAASQEETGPIISILIDVDTPPSPNYDEVRSAEANLHTIFGEIARRKGTETIFLTQDVASSRIRLLLAQYSLFAAIEFGISGKHSDDQLSTLTLSEQKAVITKSLEFAEAARICGMTEVHVTGFMPPGFDQNADTYEAIDDLGFMYNAGFQAGLIFEPGHEEDVWPYQVEGRNFYALPLSTAFVDGELVPLHDKKMAEMGISGSEWAEILKTKVDGAAANDEPVVVLVSTSVSANGEYLDALKAFLDHAVSQDATIVNARTLVNYAKTGSLMPPLFEESECIDCEEGEEYGQATITAVEPPAPEPAEAVDEETPETEEIEVEA